jgi:hypothetical protein
MFGHDETSPKAQSVERMHTMMHRRREEEPKFSNCTGFGLVLMEWADYSRRFLGASGGCANKAVESGPIVASELSSIPGMTYQRCGSERSMVRSSRDAAELVNGLLCRGLRELRQTCAFLDIQSLTTRAGWSLDGGAP